MSTEAMKLALEALKLVTWTNNPPVNKAITALREALAEPATEEFSAVQPAAQPQQEPVACQYAKDVAMLEYRCVGRCQYDTAPPAQEFVCSTGLCHYRKPLTDEEIETVWRSVQANDFHDCVKPFARAIEAKHNIKEST